MVLLVVVGAALAGGIGTEGAPEAPAGPSLPPVDAPVAAPAPAVGALPSVIMLDWPSPPNSVITTRDLVVRGHVPEGTGPVVVMLEARSPERMVIVTVNPMRSTDRDLPQLSAFVATLALPDPRPTGPAVVHVIAFEDGGTASEILLRTFRIGPELDPTYGDEAARPPTGEDGLMGGITYGTNFAWQSDGR